MSDQFWLSEWQQESIKKYSRLSRGVPSAYDRRVGFSGIIHVIRDGLR